MCIALFQEDTAKHEKKCNFYAFGLERRMLTLLYIIITPVYIFAINYLIAGC